MIGSGRISADGKFRQNPKVVSHDFGGTAYIADLDKSEVRILNGPASAIWRKAAERTTIKQAAAEIAKNSSVSPATAKADAAIFINDYLKKGLLVPAKPVQT